VTAYEDGTYYSELRYKPWGETRWESANATPTDFTYTGQRDNTGDFGLMYYVARFYDPSLGRFTSADSIVPDAGNPGAWDRFAGMMNNPLTYSDPSGHCPEGVPDGECEDGGSDTSSNCQGQPGDPAYDQCVADEIDRIESTFGISIDQNGEAWGQLDLWALEQALLMMVELFGLDLFVEIFSGQAFRLDNTIESDGAIYKSDYIIRTKSFGEITDDTKWSTYIHEMWHAVDIFISTQLLGEEDHFYSNNYYAEFVGFYNEPKMKDSWENKPYENFATVATEFTNLNTTLGAKNQFYHTTETNEHYRAGSVFIWATIDWLKAWHANR